MVVTECASAVPRVWIDSATFSDGTTISFSPTDIVVLVGPNNAGKSVALRNIEEKVKNQASPGQVITDINTKIEGKEDLLIDWLDRTSRKNTKDPSNPLYIRLGVHVYRGQAKMYWPNYQNGLHELARYFIYHLTTDARLNAANPAPNIALSTEPLSHPIHYLQADDNVEARLSGYFRQAFGEDLIVHRNAGKEVPLHCGERPIPKEGQDRVSIDYIKALEKLPTLHSQGDGMRSFVGVLLHSLVVEHSAILIDEPEAFLHPPQARLLGQMLVKETPSNRQLFIATHSGDFLRGLLDVDTNRVKIVRIQRDGDINPVKELDNSGIRKVWGDPILRYSNALDGLFHSKVIVCESDSDCRFYAAIMDAISEAMPENGPEHIMFIHCGGKSRLPVVIAALRSLDVPVRVVSDFDVLSSQDPLRTIYEGLAGRWDDISADWYLVNRAIDQKKPELNSTEVSRELKRILDGIADKRFPEQAAADIRSILRKSSPWAHAKTVGSSFVPSGDSTVACNRLFDALNAKGLFVVPVGELEGFVRSVGGHGPKWVNQVLTKDLVHDPELDEAKRFMHSILGY